MPWGRVSEAGTRPPLARDNVPIAGGRSGARDWRGGEGGRALPPFVTSHGTRAKLWGRFCAAPPPLSIGAMPPSRKSERERDLGGRGRAFTSRLRPLTGSGLLRSGGVGVPPAIGAKAPIPPGGRGGVGGVG